MLALNHRFYCCLLIAVVCLAVPACSELNPDPQARAAAEWALDRGGTVRVFGVAGEIDDPARLPRGGFALEAISLNDLDAEAPPVTDEEIEVLQGLTNLRTLGLYGSNITDEGVKTIATLKSLRELELSQSRITDKGLEMLAGLPNLERLFIRNVGDGVTADGVAQFKRSSDAEVFW